MVRNLPGEQTPDKDPGADMRSCRPAEANPRRREGRVVLFLLAIFFAGCANREPRPNLGLYKEELVRWHDSGGYAECFARPSTRAATLLNREIHRCAPGERPAVVLDIDETALSNWGYLTRRGFAITADSFRDWTAKQDDPALSPTLALFRQAKAAGVPVFFITGRTENLRFATIRQLRAAGYEGWAGLFLKPQNYALPSIVPFKSGVRRSLEKQGWKIVLNVGDQWSDLEGGHARHAVKLPNPFYFIP
jgi:predicted secreted acid phosphatase